MALHGLSHDAWQRYADFGYKHYYVGEVGFKYNMMDLQAALGLHQLQRIEDYWQKREGIWHRYMQAFALYLALVALTLREFLLATVPFQFVSLWAFLTLTHGLVIWGTIQFKRISVSTTEHSCPKQPLDPSRLKTISRAKPRGRRAMPRRLALRHEVASVF